MIHHEKMGEPSHMLHGAGIFTNIYPINEPNVGIYIYNGKTGWWFQPL